MRISDLCIELFAPEIQEIFVNDTRVLIKKYTDETTTVHPSPYRTSESMVDALQEFGFRQSVRLDPLRPYAGGMTHVPHDNDLISVRWHAVIPPMANHGPVLALRRHLFRLQYEEAADVPHPEIAEALRQGRPIFVCGSTGSGKTTVLTRILQTYCTSERVILLEEIDEIPALAPTWVKLTARPPNLEGFGAVSIETMFRETLRLAPDRIVVGEVRGPEVNPLYQAILSGHGSILTTLHIDDPLSLVLRLSQMSSSTLNWASLFAVKPPVLIFLSRKEKGEIQNVSCLSSGQIST
ncbi:MAG: ATPase, T2SS/T4P/T4SS family [Oligoflexales bacterium]